MIVLVLILCMIAVFYYSYAIYASITFFARPQAINPTFYPPISILKPICGLDSDSYTNLASFCQQDYPTYQIIFGVRSAADPAIPTLRQIIRDFPSIDIRLVVDEQTIGTNLKVSNLANVEPYALYDLLLISDSDIKVGPDYLRRIVQPMQQLQTGVVTCLYRSRVQNPIAALEALSISTDFHANVLVARQLGWLKFAMGSSILIRQTVLREIGGLKAIADYLADDFMMGNRTAKAGHKVVLSDYVVEHTLDTSSWIDLIQHQTRWNRCTRAASLSGYLGLFLGHGITLSLIFVLINQGSPFSWSVFALTLTARLLMGWVVGIRSLNDNVAKKLFWLIPVRDLLSFGLWSYGLIGDRISWRGKQFLIGKEGKLIALDPILQNSESKAHPPERVKVTLGNRHW
jgi:ceramide glucosyltransferase